MASSSTQRALTSSSSSSSFQIQTKWKYDVFLSFRGEDTRKNFVDHLYMALKNKGIHVFRDDEKLERGKQISPELLKSIEESRFSIIVFSENYASSKWCLEELVKIIDCTKETGHVAHPIFYNVDPSNVRKQTGSFAEAFAKHENDLKDNDMEKVQRWRAALSQAANLSGWDSRHRHEYVFIQEIVEELFYKLNHSMLHVDDNLIGIDFHLQEINALLSTWSKDVTFVGIYGLGGIGKTTIAKVLFNRISYQFDGCSYLADVRESSKSHGTVTLQEQLLYDILKVRDMNISNVDRGSYEIKNRLRYIRVLIILDDVDHRDQLKQLAGKHDWFGPGSRIIVTTRDEHLLVAHGVDKRYKVVELDRDESLELFSLKAFKQHHPLEDYVEISNEVVDYAKGLPLALEVLGSFLCGRDKNAWNSQLDKLKKYPNKEITDILKISYDGLDQTQKDIFLDIACFFKGKDRGYVTKILDGCGFFASMGIEVLNDRSLVSFSDNNELLMHDLVQDMGRDIVREKYPKDPSKWSRLWVHDDIRDVLMNNVDTNAVEAIMLEDFFECRPKLRLTAKAFSKMYNLRLLKINGGLFPRGLSNLPNKLMIFHWQSCPLEYFPSSFQPPVKLVELIMDYGRIKQLWKGIKVLENLISIDLSGCDNLTKVPDLTGAPILEQLILDGCEKLFELHPSVAVHRRLKYLSLRHCISLTCLPSKIEMESLDTLDLFECESLENLPELVGNMERLSNLYLECSGIMEVPSSIENITGLKELTLGKCVNLESLPSSICRLKYLEELHLDECTNLENLPEDLGNLESLVKLDASLTALKEVPFSIVRLKNLQWLSFQWCGGTSSDSQGLTLHSFSGLCSLTYMDLSNCNLSEIPNDIGSLSALETLDLTGNPFVSIPSSICLLSRLTTLTLSCCLRIRELPELPSSIETIHANDCVSLERVSIASTVFKPKNVCFGFINCYNLVNENASNLTDVLQQFQNQALFGDFETVSICLPGNAIPEWFSHQNTGSSTSILLPPNRDNNKLQGLAFCIVTDVWLRDFEIQVFGVDLKENAGSGIIGPYASEFNFSYEGYGYQSCAHMMLGYVSRDLLGQNERQLTNVSFHFKDIDVVKVKNCGIRLVYDDDDDNDKEKGGLKRSRSWKSSGESEKTPRIQ